MALKKMYYWLGMKSEVFKHCKTCKECMLQNQANTSGEFKHFKVPEVPMQLICMDLVGPIYPVTSRGNRSIPTCIDMLTGFTIAVPIKDKTASTVCNAYRAHVYCIFGGSARILTDNGTEFKNEQMDELCRQLNVKRVYSPVYMPEANGRLEAWHRFFKACVAKHIRGNVAEWDEVVPLAGAAYNFFPCQASGESPFCVCKIVGASSKILGRSWRPPKNGFVKKTLFTHSRECEKSKGRARSHGNDQTEK